MNLQDMFSYGSRIFKKSGPPIQLTFFVTSQCNLRCQHCFYWKAVDSENENELTLEEIQTIAQSLSRLLVLSLTGGEPFVRKDIGEICDVFARNTRPHILTIATNGFYKDKMEQLIPKVLTDFPKTNLYIYLSIDGPEEVHDKIRGINSYIKAIEALKMLQQFRKTFKNFGVSISMTYNKFNEDYLQDFFKELAKSQLADNVNIGFVRGDPKNPSVKNVNIEKYKELTQLRMRTLDNKELKYFNFFLSKFVSLKDYYTYKIVEEVLEHDHYVLPCHAGSLMGILYEDGDVFPCEMLENSSLGNVRDFNYDLPQLWASNRAKAIRKQITSNRCYCTFECAMSSNILFNPKYLSKIAIKTLSS